MTTWTLAPSGGDYTTLAAALSNASTVASDVIEVEGDWTGAYDSGAGASVDDDNITIRGKVGDQARHDGHETNGANYKLIVTSGDCLEVNNTGVVIDGLVFILDSGTTGNQGIELLNDGGTSRIINTIIRSDDIGSQQNGVSSEVDHTIEMENVIISGFGGGGTTSLAGSGETVTYNMISCTVWGNGRTTAFTTEGNIVDDNSGGGTTVYNCHNVICVDPDNGPCFEDNSGGSSTFNLDNCIDTDGTITGLDAGAVNATENVTVVAGNPTSGQLGFVDLTASLPDLRLFDDAADNVAMGQHSNDPGAGLNIGDYAGAFDIAGTARSAPYDVGAFRRTAAVGGNTETLAAVATGVAALNRSLSAERSLAATATGVAAISLALQLSRTLAAVAVGVATLTTGLSFSRTLSATATGVAVVSRQLSVFKTLSATATGIAVLAASRLFEVTLSAIATVVATLTAAFTEAPEEPGVPFSGHAGIQRRSRWKLRRPKWKSHR